MELASTVGLVVKSIAPVYAKQAYHREEYPHAHTCGTLDLEGVELAEIRPAVTALQECQGIDGGLRLEDYRITELDGELVVQVTGVAGTALAVRRDLTWSK